MKTLTESDKEIFKKILQARGIVSVGKDTPFRWDEVLDIAEAYHAEKSNPVQGEELDNQIQNLLVNLVNLCELDIDHDIDQNQAFELIKEFMERMNPSPVTDAYIENHFENECIIIDAAFTRERIKGAKWLRDKIQSGGEVSEEAKNEVNINIGQNLFNVLYNTCDFTALESEQFAVLDAVKADNPQLFKQNGNKESELPK